MRHNNDDKYQNLTLDWKMSWSLRNGMERNMCLAQLKAMSQTKPSLFELGQARPLVTAQQWLWPGSVELKAKATSSGHGFSCTNLIIEVCVNYYFSNLL